MWSLGVGFFHVVSLGTCVSDSYNYSEGLSVLTVYRSQEWTEPLLDEA